MPSEKKTAVQNKFKKGVEAYKKYKKKNPSGCKKLTCFIKEAFHSPSKTN